MSDAAIQQSIEERLGRSKIAVNHFQFKVQGGTVVWTGKTDVIQHKGAATRMAKAAGARRVDNRIVISEAARLKAAARLQRAHNRGAAERPGAVMKRAVVTPRS